MSPHLHAGRDGAFQPGVYVDLLRLHWRKPSRRAMADWPSGTRLLEFANAVIRVREVGSGQHTILLTPDAPVVLENYSRLIDQLAPHARVICFEFPGCGFSFPRFGFQFRFSDYVDVVRAVMDHHGVERATLAFTCVNALVAMGYARQYPSRVAGLALAQVASVDQMQAFTERIDFSVAGVRVLGTPIIGQAFMMGARTVIAHRWFRAALPKGFDTDQVWTDTRKVFDAGGVFCLASLMQGLSAIRPEDVTSDVAASVAWGSADRTHRPTDKASIRAHLPHVTIDTLSECGHCPDIEAPEAYSRRLLALCSN